MLALIFAFLGLSGHAAPPKKILVVLSAEHRLPLRGTERTAPAGYYLNELAVPAQRLVAAGYELVVATPEGRPAHLDARSDSPKHFRSRDEYDRARAFVRTLPPPRALAGAEAGDYAAVFVPGGHAPMTDLMRDSDLGKLLRRFHDQKKPTALICHGPVALAAAVREAKDFQVEVGQRGDLDRAARLAADWPYRDYRMTVFSNAEEKAAQKALGGRPTFYAEDALRLAGGKLEVGPPFVAHVVRDRELITGQNPKSDEALARSLLEALKE